MLFTTTASRSMLLALVALAALAAGCSNTDSNSAPGLYPFQLPINTGIAGRTDPVLLSIRLEPGGGINLQLGTGLDLKAIGVFSDGTEFDIAPLAIWQQSNPLVGTLTSTGDFTAFNTGVTTIFCRVDSVYSDAAFINASNQITSPPSAAQNLRGTILPGNEFRLRWDTNPIEEDVIGYVVYRSRISAVFTFVALDSDPVSPDMIAPEPIPSAEYTDATAVGGVVYYVVQAVRRDVNDPTVLIYGAPSRQLKVNFITGEIGEGN